MLRSSSLALSTSALAGALLSVEGQASSPVDSRSPELLTTQVSALSVRAGLPRALEGSDQRLDEAGFAKLRLAWRC